MTSLLSYLWHHCWHQHYTWPIKLKKGQPSYQICLDCGARREYDLKTMTAGTWWRKTETRKKPVRRVVKSKTKGKIISISNARPSVSNRSQTAFAQGGSLWNAYLARLF